MAETRADVTVTIRGLLKEAEEGVLICTRERDAAQIKLGLTRDALRIAKAHAGGLSKALSALEGTSGMQGRPRGTGDPKGITATVQRMLLSRHEWSGIELRDALIAEGMEVTSSRVSAALARLRENGVAVRHGKGRWASTERGVES